MQLAIIGGGISGLAAAFEAHKLGLDFQLFESSSRFGGTLETLDSDGVLMEGGADSILRTKPWALELVRELGLESEMVSTKEDSYGSYVVCDRELHPIPDGFRLMAPTTILSFLRSPILSWPGKFRVFLELFMPKNSTGQDESLTSFVTRRLGREVLEKLAQPMVSGIYSADPDCLSLEATMPIFLRLEQEYGSVIKGLRALGEGEGASGARYNLFFSLRHGVGQLVDTLVASLPEERLLAGCPITKVVPEEGGWRLSGPGRELTSEAVLLALPAPLSAELVGFDPDLSAKLNEVRYSSAALVNMIYHEESTLDLPEGYGFVVPEVEQMHLLACTFTHHKWPDRTPPGKAQVRAYFGGHHNQAVLERSDQELVALARSDLARLTGLEDAPLDTHVSRHWMGLPEYSVGHLGWQQKVEAMAGRHPGLSLAGNAFDGVGVPDCIRRGRECARHISRALASPVGS